MPKGWVYSNAQILLSPLLMSDSNFPRRALPSCVEGSHDDRERVRAAVDARAVLAVVLGDTPRAAPHAVSGLPAAQVALLLLRLLLLRAGMNAQRPRIAWFNFSSSMFLPCFPGLLPRRGVCNRGVF